MRVPAAVSEIRRYVRSPEYRADRSKFVLAAIDRLVKLEDVFPVWKGLTNERDHTLPINFIHACSDALLDWEHMPHVPDKEMNRNLAKLAKTAESLAAGLDRNAGEIRSSGIPLYVANNLASLSDANRTRPESEAHSISADERQGIRFRFRSPSLYDPGNVIGPTLIQSVLKELAQRLRAPDEGWRSALRPTKARDKNAKQTFLVKSLVRFFLTNGGEPHWDWVARSVAAMIDLDTFGADDARKAAPGTRPMFSDPGEELLWYNKNVYGEPKDEE